MDLFDVQHKKNEGPLAARMRPRNLDEYIGQDHIVGKGRLLRRAIAADQLTSVIFYGPPGTGKTTLAKVIANHTKSNFITLNAVLSGVQSIRDSIKSADEQHKLYGKKTILFVDEVHRWNKSQQDALLPWVENGTIILVGATTENPFFEVNKALVSRSRVFQLKPLTKEDLHKAVSITLNDKERGYGRWKVTFEEGALEHLIETANGDARSLLNALELAVETTPKKWTPNENPCYPPENSEIYIDKETCEESIQKKVVLYDRDGDYHYDIISAFIKSLRGRDPDAALYWLARMVSAGEDPHFIFRRMLISACEDTGLADPNALTVVQSCAAAFDRIGLPEGQYMLTQAALYLATAPKSNSSMAYFDALRAVQTEDAEVPNHLRDASRDSDGFAHGAGYLYPHAYKDHWVSQQYLPDGLDGRVFYNPSNQGYENTIREDVLNRRELQIAGLIEDTQLFPMGDWWEAEHLRHGEIKTGENLTYSPNGKSRAAKQEAWQKRTESNRTKILQEIKNTTCELANLKRHHRCLIMKADDGLLVWDVWRKTPEGLTCGVCQSPEGKKILSQYSSTLDEIEKPILALDADWKNQFSDFQFDFVFYRDMITKSEDIGDLCDKITELKDCGFLGKEGKIILSQKIPVKTQKLSELLLPHFGLSSQNRERELLNKLKNAENQFYSGKNENPAVKSLFDWDGESFSKAFFDKGFQVSYKEEVFSEERVLSIEEIEKWFNKESSYGKCIFSVLQEEDFESCKKLVLEIAKYQKFNWKHVIGFMVLA